MRSVTVHDKKWQTKPVVAGPAPPTIDAQAVGNALGFARPYALRAPLPAPRIARAILLFTLDVITLSPFENLNFCKLPKVQDWRNGGDDGGLRAPNVNTVALCISRLCSLTLQVRWWRTFFFFPSSDEEEAKMSILHTLAPVRSNDESLDKSETMIASPSAAGRHVVPTALDMHRGRRLRGVVSAWDIAGNRHGSVPVPPTGRERSAAAGWSKEFRFVPN
ncbi:hypothetical protein EVAR_21395_1 [Eumeta japonica]|uniref:Uncharacterized protein n=1 Tax=Eumeta variegata TaxID=151549 RepID=A0A4C1VGW1_EUMVA|nr:hypothetical protein EVAR_21395_1 [Eumeta japonica]